MVENYSKIISHIFAKSSILASESGSNFYENASSLWINLFKNAAPGSKLC
jgi:hypothetical protein